MTPTIYTFAVGLPSGRSFERRIVAYSEREAHAGVFEQLDDYVKDAIEMIELVEQKPCDCRRCLRERNETGVVFGVPVPAEMTRMIFCAICGNKRCPHANDHRNACTGSNAPGQPGSAYP